MSTSSSTVYILGLSCFYHDAAAALIQDGRLVATAEQERFSRKKHDAAFPQEAIAYCLREAGIGIGEVSAVVFYEKPLLKFERVLTSFIQSWPLEFNAFRAALGGWMHEKLWILPAIRKELGFSGPVYFSTHHLSHASSAFFVSPFERAAILTVDGVGEWATTALAHGVDNHIIPLQEIKYPHSLGLFYAALTHFLGFQPNSDEYKVMGLAAYGTPLYGEKLRSLFTLHEDGSFALGPKVFGGNFVVGRIEKELAAVLGFSKRVPESALRQEHKDLAASLQQLTNDAMVRLARHARQQTGEDNLCLAGGVALNCVANTEIFRQAGFKNIFIQPLAGDGGGALGAAYYLWHQVQKQPRSFQMDHCFFGPEFTNEEIKCFLESGNIAHEYLDTPALLEKVCRLLADQKAVGWFQGRMEAGPRALGNRSILADPRNAENWPKVNLKIKLRESFRPFAPAVLADRAPEYFAPPNESPFMLLTTQVKSTDLPAVTHVDGTARIQTVSPAGNPRFHQLLQQFDRLTGCPVLINTSFNQRGQPIVCTPPEAWRMFADTDLDALVLENFLLTK